MKSQASEALNPESLQSQNRLRQKFESSIKPLGVLHGRLHTDQGFFRYRGLALDGITNDFVRVPNPALSALFQSCHVENGDSVDARNETQRYSRKMSVWLAGKSRALPSRAAVC
jgi:hypothetical protein